MDGGGDEDDLRPAEDEPLVGGFVQVEAASCAHLSELPLEDEQGAEVVVPLALVVGGDGRPRVEVAGRAEVVLAPFVADREVGQRHGPEAGLVVADRDDVESRVYRHVPGGRDLQGDCDEGPEVHQVLVGGHGNVEEGEEPLLCGQVAGLGLEGLPGRLD